MAPEDVLVATTSGAAELLGLDGDSGTVSPGKRADFVVLDGDPLDLADIGSRVAAVFQAGQLVSGALPAA
jgi:imidazolonepropionase-like amidohydrolase